MAMLTPLDGRYSDKLSGLIEVIGEDALTRRRVFVETQYLIALSQLSLFKLSPGQKNLLRSLQVLSYKDFKIIKALEFTGYKGVKPTNHDVKAIEYFLRGKLSSSSFKNRLQWLHFALTSEDVNSVSYALMLREAVEKVFVPLLGGLQNTLLRTARKYAGLTMLARTHGQAAVPTTFGKEIRVFEYRLSRQLERLKKQSISCKFGGAAGNFNAHFAAFEKIDWPVFAKKFINSFNKGRRVKIYAAALSTQIDSHDSYAELFDNLRRVNTILLDLCQDMWRYISDGLLLQKTVAGEVGSSTMPQKVNPIDFENAEGNFGLAGALYSYFSAKLPVSRLQRDLSDSTVLRNVGAAFGYNVLAIKALARGLSKVEPRPQAFLAQLEERPEVLAEGIQTILRAAGVENPYEKLKDLTRGKKITAQGLRDFIEGLAVGADVKARLKKLSVKNYAGIAAKLARSGK
ncbi:MAG: adenylosuccinate lyase [Elusimicrobiota bacterium]|jgi:adenylosuccinate lyase|nr:adenylosuccinate lyase [Elusimicrobiota bacterium]